MKNLSLPIRFSLVTSAVLIAYFLVLALFNKHTNPAFSFFNAVITAFGIYEVIRLKKLEDPDNFSYGEGFKTGIITGFIATLIFTVFFLFYATEINASFLPELLQIINGGFNADIGMVTFVVLVMGLATTVVCVLSVMQLFKNSRNILQN
jgi:glycerol uptake facilitator-like aquaporin